MVTLKSLYSRIEGAVNKVLYLLEVFLFLRLLLKFLGANPRALVVGLIYKYTDIFIHPFKFIFPDIYWRFYLIEIATISAMLGYWLAVYIIFILLRLFSKD
jgi:hypothetical protein